LAFKVSIAKIASYLSICCAIQVAISPWFIYARRTPQRPEGRVTHRLIAVTLFTTTITLLFLSYIGRSRPEDPATLQSALIAMGVTIIFAVVYLVIKLALRTRKR
jgi:FtsH-binding integral membrane protein